MDLQTQVADQTQTVSASDVDLASRVATFKDQVSKLRATRVGLVDKMRALADEITKLYQSKSDFLSMFKSEAVKMRPELITADVFSMIQMNYGPPELFQLWQAYSGRLLQIDGSISFRTAQFEKLKKLNDQYAAQEDSLFSQYDQFAYDNAGQVPSGAELRSQVQALEIIPQVEQGNVIASGEPNALETLPGEVADQVTLQATNMMTDYDRQAVNAELVNSMAPASVEMPSGGEPTNGDGVPLVGQNGPIKTWHLVLAGVGLFYILFGGKD